MELWSLGARVGDAELNVQRSLPNGELCDPGTYATLERRRWISTPSTITKSAPATIWMMVTLLMAISFHEKLNTGFNYATVVTRPLSKPGVGVTLEPTQLWSDGAGSVLPARLRKARLRQSG